MEAAGGVEGGAVGGVGVAVEAAGVAATAVAGGGRAPLPMPPCKFKE